MSPRTAYHYDADVKAIVKINPTMGAANGQLWKRAHAGTSEIDGYPTSTGLDGSGSHSDDTTDSVAEAVIRREAGQYKDPVENAYREIFEQIQPQFIALWDRMMALHASIGVNLTAKPETPKCSHHAQFGIEAPVWADKTAAKLCRWCWTYKDRNKRLPSPAEIDQHAQGRKVA